MPESYLVRGLGEFLDLVAARRSAPGGGAVAAVSVSLAAGLVAMAARYSAGLLEDGEQLVAEAEGLRSSVSGLADEDARAYAAVIGAYVSVRASDDDGSREQVRTALTRAAEVPLQVAELGAATARLAVLLAVEGKRDVRGDAATAVLLAEAATRSAAGLVAINVEAGGGDSELIRRAAVSVETAQAAAAALTDGR